MKTFISVLKNDYLRTIPRIVGITVLTIVTLVTMVLAVYMTDVQKIKGHIVLITKETDPVEPISSEALDITVVTQRPPQHLLMEQKYDAYVTLTDSGEYQIETLRNTDFKNMLQYLLKHPKANIGNKKTDRGVGVNILGFMMMFLLMISFSNLYVFADDKEQGQLGRIAAAPVSFVGYLMAHCIYCLSLILPEYLLLVIMKLFGGNIGFSLPEYAGLMSVLAFLGISFALLLNTLIKKPDNASMLGNATTVLTSILAGSFYSFSKNNPLLDHIISFLPQKELMNFAMHVQNHEAMKGISSILYVIAFALVLFGFSFVLLRMKYVKVYNTKTPACQSVS